MGIRVTAATIVVGTAQQLEISQGEDREFRLTFNQDGSVLDFTGARSIRLAVKSRTTGAEIFSREYSGFQGLASAGTPRFRLLASDTANIVDAPYDCDVRWDDVDGLESQILVLSTFLLLRGVGQAGDVVTSPPAVPVVYGLNWLGSWSTPTGGYNPNDAVTAQDGSLGATAVSSFRALAAGVTLYPINASLFPASGWAYVGQHGGAGVGGGGGGGGGATGMNSAYQGAASASDNVIQESVGKGRVEIRGATGMSSVFKVADSLGATAYLDVGANSGSIGSNGAFVWDDALYTLLAGPSAGLVWLRGMSGNFYQGAALDVSTAVSHRFNSPLLTATGALLATWANNNALKLVIDKDGKIGPTIAQAHTIPAVAEDTFALLGAPQTLVNKAINGASNTFTSVPDSSVTYGGRQAGQFLGSPAGVSGTPTFRALVAGDLPNTAVATGVYGDFTHVAGFTVDAQGRIVAATAIAITGITGSDASKLPLAGGTMLGAISFTGVQLGNYTFGGSPALGASLGIAADNAYVVGATGSRLARLHALSYDAGATSAVYRGWGGVDGASAVGHIFDTPTVIAAVTGRFMAIRSGGVDQFSIGNWSGGASITNIINPSNTGLLFQAATALYVMVANVIQTTTTTSAFKPQADFGLANGATNARWTDTYSRRYGGVEQSLAAGATLTLNPAAGETVLITLSPTAVTAVLGSLGYPNERMTVFIAQDGTGGRTLTGWSSGTTGGFKLAGGAYTPTPGASAMDSISWQWNNTIARWVEVGRAMNLLG